MEQNPSDLGEYAAAAPVDSRDEEHPFTDFSPVPLRYRHDGWTPDRQLVSSSRWPHAAVSRKRRAASA